MKKGIFLACLTISLLCSTNIHAYSVASSRPSSKTLTWGIHDNTPTAAVNPAINASGDWGSNDGLTAKYNFESYKGNIDPTDNNNTVGALISSIPGAPSGWIAAAPHPSSNYTSFDIVLNSNMNFGTGSSVDYFDYEGVFSHEFGHVFGLNDLYLAQCVGKTADNLPTMYGKATFLGVQNIYYYLRSREVDDISGKRYVASLID